MDIIIIPIFKSLRQVKKGALVTKVVRDRAGALNQGQSALETMLLMVKLQFWKEPRRHVKVGNNLGAMKTKTCQGSCYTYPQDMSRPVFLSLSLQFSQPLSIQPRASPDLLLPRSFTSLKPKASYLSSSYLANQLLDFTSLVAQQ